MAMGGDIVEVKSSLFNPEVDDDLIDDVCYTVMVASRCGVKINGASLLQLRREYRRNAGVDKMFGETDLTTVVQERLPLFSSPWKEIGEATAGRISRWRSRRAAAFLDCPYYADHCLGKGLDHPVLELSRIRTRSVLSLMPGYLTCAIPRRFCTVAI